MKQEEKYIAYLSDDELEQLIAQVEENELVEAPPEIIDNVLARIAQEGIPNQNQQVVIQKVTPFKKTKAQKQKEYRKYCMQVITSVAAAIVILLVMPQQVKREFVSAPIPTQEEMVKDNMRTKEEVLHSNIKLEQLVQQVDYLLKEQTKKLVEKETE